MSGLRFGPPGPVNAGAGASRQGPLIRSRLGTPFHAQLPGLLNAVGNVKSRRRVAGAVPAPPDLDPQARCYLEFAVALVCRCIGETFVNIQLHARPPSHIAPPFGAQCMDRHVGTGAAGTSDPPINLPVGGAFVPLLDHVVPIRSRTEFVSWGVAVDPAGELGQTRWRMIVGNHRVSEFSLDWSAMAAATTGDWVGPPFGLRDSEMGSLCIHLREGQRWRLEAAYTGAAPAGVNVAARVRGWSYRQILSTADNRIDSTLVDKP